MKSRPTSSPATVLDLVSIAQRESGRSCLVEAERHEAMVTIINGAASKEINDPLQPEVCHLALQLRAGEDLSAAYQRLGVQLDPQVGRKHPLAERQAMATMFDALMVGERRPPSQAFVALLQEVVAFPEDLLSGTDLKGLAGSLRGPFVSRLEAEFASTPDRPVVVPETQRPPGCE